MNQKKYGRIQHLYKLWQKALNEKKFPQFDRWLSNEFSLNKQYGSKDRRWYSEALFAAIRHGYFALFCQSFLESKETNISEKYLEQFQNKFPTQESIFSGLKNIPSTHFFAFVFLRYACSVKKSEAELSLSWDFLYESSTNKEELNLLHKNFSVILQQFENNTSLSFCCLFYSVPLWLSSYLKNRIEYSKLTESQLTQFLNHLDTRSPLWIRLNHEDKKQEVLDELKKENFICHELNSAIEIIGSKGIFNLKSYQNGFFEIQDLASQSIGERVQAKGKQSVWDCCAGGGGKTMQIASQLRNKGIIYASDIREFKLEEVKKRSKRAQFFNIRCLPWKGEELPVFQKEIQIKGGFDWVLVDAPCSSSGTWRRNPDAKYRIDTKSISELNALQLQILSHACPAVVPGGRLVYSTCSWLVEENEGLVEQFLHTHQNFKLLQQNVLGSPLENSDSMYCAVLEKSLEN